jgi:hypothetical protein
MIFFIIEYEGGYKYHNIYIKVPKYTHGANVLNFLYLTTIVHEQFWQKLN